MIRPFALWLCVGCIETNVVAKNPPDDPTTPPPTTPVPSLDLPGPGPVAQGDSCASACAPSPAWDVVVEWEEMPLDDGMNYAPSVIAWLDDPDGDGVYGEPAEVPQILYGATDWTPGEGVFGSWAGDGSGLTVAYDEPLHSGVASPLVADIDGDGDPEIVVVTGNEYESHVEAMEPDGTPIWSSEPFFLGVEDWQGSGSTWIYNGACQPTITDLEGDGHPEVFCDVLLLDGATGATRWQHPLDTELFWVTTTIADLDLDGVAEIVSGANVWRADGTLWWQGDVRPKDGHASYPAAMNLDADPEGEVVFAADGSLTACDTDGTVLWSTEVLARGKGVGSPPCVADFDGDGALEIAAAFQTVLAVFESDGTVRWTQPVADASTAAGCFGFDFDLDGSAEVVYADEEDFSLFCGGDGTVLFRDPEHRSGTGTEYPLVADVDGDGAAEIVVGRSATDALPAPGVVHGLTGFVVYGQADGDWPVTGAIWPQQDYQLTNQTDAGRVDGTIPSWLAGGAVHSRPAEGTIVPPEDRFPGTDLEVVLVDRIGDCDGLSLSVQVQNTGPGEAAAGRVLEVWAVDVALLGEETRRLVRELPLPAIPAGTALGAMQVDLAPAEIGVRWMELAIRADAGSLECEPADDTVVAPTDCG